MQVLYAITCVMGPPEYFGPWPLILLLVFSLPFNWLRACKYHLLYAITHVMGPLVYFGPWPLRVYIRP